LRDDIFVNKDRTKFFDFILSVVPVLDSSNAYDQMKAHFEKGGIFTIFEEKFLRGLSLYIDDMRVLKNIYNEFMIYYNKLNTIELNPNKMLAMITYKNIFPRDFSELQLNQGFVFELFNRKEEFIIQDKKLYAKRIESKGTQINNIKNEELKSIEELNYIKNIYHDEWRRYGRYSQYAEWEKNQYPARKKAIEDKAQNKMGEFEKELAILQEEIHILENKTLHEIITRENIDEIFRITSANEIGNINEYKEIKGSEYFSLLKYLIRHGYIDESYNDYMTFFYENSLTKRDKMFLRSVRDKVARPFSYALDNVGLVMSNLDVYDFEQEETLNYDLFEYLLQNRTKQDILLCFVKQLKNEERYQFISGFFETKREKANLVMTINKQWSEFFEEVLSKQKMPAQQIQDYSLATLEYSEAVDLSTVNMNNCLTEYISSQQQYLAVEKPDITKLCKVMKELGVAFKRIDYQASNKDLFDAVYQNDLYEINIENVCLMLETEYHIKDVSKQYVSFVFSKPEQPLFTYIQKNIDIFMESILRSPVEEFIDKSVDAVMIINNIDVSEENKLAYIERLKTPISVLGDIDEVKYQTKLVVKMGIQYSAENILEYFKKAGMTDDLVEFIDSEKSHLDYCNNEIYSSELIVDFWNQCILSKKLSLQKFKEILLNIKPVYKEFDTLGVPNDKMRILIKEKIIPMTNKTLAFMRENFQDIKMEYIVNNISEYVNIATGSMASAEEVESILSYDIADELKIELLSEISDGISVIEQNYSDRITAYILANNLNESDVLVLYKNYKDFGLEVQQEILIIAKRNIDQIIDEPQNVCRDIIVELIKDTSIDKSERVNLFILMIKEMTSEECIQYFKILGMPQFVKIFEQNKRPKIPISTLNQKILTALKRAGFINDFSTDEENGVYKQFRRGVIQSKLPDVLL